MIITINTDASFSSARNIGSYAFWIVCNLGRIQRSGPLRDRCHDSTHAEMGAIVNALWSIHKSPLINDPNNKIIINTDSLNAIHIFTNDTKSINKYGLKRKQYNKVKDTMKYIRRKLKGVEIEFRHVRSHTGINDKRSYVNEWCDHAAKAALMKIISYNLESV